MRVGGAYIDQMQIRVPIDETHTWKLFYSTHNPGEKLTTQERPHVYEYLWKDEDGRFITDYIEGQDVMAWVSQGEITDRTQEHLGRSDGGVALLRKMFKENMRKVANGEDPIGTVRYKHDIINLPCEKDKFGAERTFAAAWINGGSMRYSPIKDELLALHESYWSDLEKAEAGA
jgi:5,5'-dehydrodivanillate O-demethylase